ncbi:glycosyltransferase family 4 protein [Francisella sp. 19X1-34]|uniref:glycosyltransferase family 4 protein n=1 Tax=Francisella sp. 19X1-34 TaxID=3087177 RepID=UPI002E36A021|nr:glycosyltransferase family 4 protein [Francisella sp. 19X1-34]MED7787883.1 glycosyltransferase family 4 protein [Francisella sp. 19X1-34]
MKIALAHFRVGETDGVSLEMDKWKIALEKQGHEVFYLAGSSGQTQAYIVEELHYKNSLNDKIVSNAYLKLDDYTAKELEEIIEIQASIVEQKIVDFIQSYNIDLLIPNNIWSLGWGLYAGIGFYKAAIKTGIKCIAHHHDFYWEREKYSQPTCDFVKKLLEEYFPPVDTNIKHVVINSLAQDALLEKKQVKSTVVPNVFDFRGPLWTKDEYNSDFRKSIGVDKNDILILQATRITERKGIELALDVIGELISKGQIDSLYDKKLSTGRYFSKNNKVVFVMAGLLESEDIYITKLNAKAKKYGIEIKYINDVIDHSRSQRDNKKIYSLWDAYVEADFVTYPSLLEGWGNQLLEAMFAKKPVLVYEYPVYKKDLLDKGFDVVSLGDRHIMEDGLAKVDQGIISSAAYKIKQLLIDKNAYDQAIEKNFNICCKYFSYESLENLLKNIVE